MILLLVVFAAFMYFFMLRPQKKQQQKRMEMMDQLKKGDRVILVDGLHGKVDSINNADKTVVIDADGIYLTFSRMAIRQVLPSDDATAETAENSETAETPETTSEEKATDADESKTAEADESQTADDAKSEE